MKKNYKVGILHICILIPLCIYFVNAAVGCHANCHSTTAGTTGCTTFGSNDVCTKCQAGYKLTYSPASGVCTACAAGTGDDGFFKASGCPACANGYGATAASECKRCTQLNCFQCTLNPANCDGCKSGYSLTGGECVLCAAGTYSSEGTNGVTGACQNCPAGKYRSLLGGTKVQDCAACAFGYGSNAGATTCYQCTVTGCQQCNVNASTCTQCIDGYFGTTSCTKCVDNCQKCPDLTNCNQASEGYRIETTSPLKIVACTIDGCGTCVVDSSAKEYCQTCKVGYSTKNGSEVTVNSQKFNQVTCTVCPAYYGRPSGGAQSPGSPPPTNCEKCEVPDEQNCIACSKFNLQTCDKCIDNFQLDNNSCVYIGDQLDYTCLTAKGTTNTDCLTCDETRDLIDGKCVCKKYYYQVVDEQRQQCHQCDPTCPECTRDQCTQCPDRLILVGKVCVKSGTIVPGYFEKNGAYSLCHSTCETCKDQTENDCLTCNDVPASSGSDLIVGFLLEGQCHQKCPQKYVVSPTQMECDLDVTLLVNNAEGEEDNGGTTTTSSQTILINFGIVIYLISLFI